MPSGTHEGLKRLAGTVFRLRRRQNWTRRAALLAGIVLVVILALGSGTYALFFAGSSRPTDASSVNLSKGLVGYWKLNGNAKDSTPYGNDGTISGGTSPTPATDRRGAADGAVTFDGSGQSYSVANTPVLQITGDETISLWLKPASFSSRQNPICKAYGGEGCITQETNGALHYYWGTLGDNGTPYQQLLTTGRLSLNTWSLLTVVRNFDTGTVTAYMNGQYDSQISTTGYDPAVASSLSWLIGTGYAGNYDGSIDDVRLYNRAIDPAEVKALYDQYDTSTNIDSLQSGLVGEWKLAGNAKDSTPYGNNGMVYGSTVSADREGVTPGAYCFNGTASDYIDFGDPAISSPGSSSYSISIWFKANASGQLNSSIVYNKENMFEVSAGGGYFTYAWEPDWNWDGGTSFPINVGQWYNATIVYDGANQYLYKNGSLVYTRAQTGAMGSNTNRLALATRGTSGGGSSPFNGCMDDFRIYKRALSAQAVSDLYNSYGSQINLGTSTAPTGQAVNLTTGLVGYWPFSGNAKDATPYGDDGTVNGATLTTDRFGRASSAYGFNGSSYIAAGNNPITGSHAFTLAAWINSTQVSQYAGALAVGPSGGGQAAYIGTVNQAQAGTGNSIGGGFYGVNLGSGITTTNQWAHVALTFSGGSGGTATIYVNGVAKVSTTYTPNMATGPTQMGKIGSDTTYNFTGSVDDVRIYNRALSAAEVQALYDLND